MKTERVLVVSMYSIAVFFYSTKFIDETTYPKLVSLVLFACLLVMLESRKRANLSILFLLLVWMAIVALYLIKYDEDVLTSILIGYPRRNLGLLAFLIFLLLFWYALRREVELPLFCVFMNSCFVSISYWLGILIEAGKDQQTAFVLLTQFSFPLRSSINQNIISGYLTIGIMSSIWILLLLRLGVRFRRWVILGIFLNFVTLLKIGDSQSQLFLVVFSLVLLITYNIRTLARRRNLFVFGMFFIPVTYFYVLIRINEFAAWLPYSWRERAVIAQLAIEEIFDMPFMFRLPDSTADSLTSYKYSMANQLNIVDNTHNFWLELGIHLGWINLSFIFVACVASLVYLVMRFEKLYSQQSQIIVSMFYGSLIVGYVATFVSILHPITISALAFFYGSIFSLVAKKRKDFVSLENSTKRLQSLNQLIRVLNSFKSYIALKYFIIFIAMVPISLVISDFEGKLRYSSAVESFKANKISTESALDLFQSLSIETKDRLYLDFTGRQFADIGDCKRVETIILTQQKIRAIDKNTRLLQDWFVRNC